MAGEKLFENQIKRWFHSIGIYSAGFPSDKMTVDPVGWYFKEWGGGMSRSGIPDIIACINGFMFGIEVKASRGRPSELQKLNVLRINQAGGIGIILYPEGFEVFKKLIEEVIDCSGHTAELKRLKNANSNTKCIILMG